MTQEQLDKLIEDSFELHCYGDMSEIGEFLGELAHKYKLYFECGLYNRANNFQHYKDNIYIGLDGTLKAQWGS